MEAHNGAVVFRLLQPYAKAEFAPSQQFRTDLLSLARESTRVDIRGRTDAIADNAGDRMVARRRALCAQAYLVDNGVPANKIRVSFLAAGDRVASNATPEGRALNRRIEIETLGVNTSNLRGGSSDVMGSL